MTHVLLVDDEPGMIETLTDILVEYGYTVSTAETGEEAIELVERKPFDVVFMDVRMPGLNGVETFKQIKKTQPGIVVMMMTAYSVEDLLEEAIGEGAKGVMYKPIDISKTLVFLENVEDAGLVLIVDDDLGTCESLLDVLNEKGYKTMVARDGPESFKLVSRESFDFCFIDIKLPVLNGFEVYKKLREIDPGVKAVLMTGYRNEVEVIVEQALRDDCLATIYKPFEVDLLLEVLDRVVNNG